MTSVFSRLKRAAVGAAFCWAAGAQAQQEVKIGVVYPLTGPAASSGAEMKNALQGRVGSILPPPPPMSPDILGTSFPVGFSCNVQAACE